MYCSVADNNGGGFVTGPHGNASGVISDTILSDNNGISAEIHVTDPCGRHAVSLALITWYSKLTSPLGSVE